MDVPRSGLLKPLTLALAGILALPLACSTPVQPPTGATGAEIYELQLCANCHGKQGSGRSIGPPLLELKAHWSRENLADFLVDPQGWAERDARVGRLAASYPGKMNSYANLSSIERARLADFLLGL